MPGRATTGLRNTRLSGKGLRSARLGYDGAVECPVGVGWGCRSAECSVGRTDEWAAGPGAVRGRLYAAAPTAVRLAPGAL